MKTAHLTPPPPAMILYAHLTFEIIPKKVVTYSVLHKTPSFVMCSIWPI